MILSPLYLTKLCDVSPGNDGQMFINTADTKRWGDLNPVTD